jgi:hypothetical protein
VPLNMLDAGSIRASAGCIGVPGTIETVNKGVQLSAIRDPEGNTITFIGNFRVQY